MCARVCVHVCVCVCACVCGTSVCTRVLACIGSLSVITNCLCMQAHVYTQTCHTHAHTHMHARTHAHTHARMNARTHARITHHKLQSQTCTHTHTQLAVFCPCARCCVLFVCLHHRHVSGCVCACMSCTTMCGFARARELHEQVRDCKCVIAKIFWAFFRFLKDFTFMSRCRQLLNFRRLWWAGWRNCTKQLCMCSGWYAAK